MREPARSDRTEALTTLQAVLAAAPRREGALGRAATLAQDLNQTEPALDYWRRAVEVKNVWVPYGD